MEIRFKLERETKNTLRFQEETEDEPTVGTIYLRKSAARALGGGQYPQEISVTISA
jgi:hypothetical protein